MGLDNDQNRDGDSSDHRRRDSAGRPKHRTHERESYREEREGDVERRSKRKERGEDGEERGEKRSRNRDGVDEREGGREERSGERSRNRDGVDERESGREEREGSSERRNKGEERGGERLRNREGADEREGGREERGGRSRNRDGVDERESGREEREGLLERRIKGEERGENRSRNHEGVDERESGREERGENRPRNREGSYERESGREEREGLGERRSKGEKRGRVFDDVAEEGKKQRRRFGDKADPKEGRREGRERESETVNKEEEEIVVKKEATNGDGAKATSFASVNGPSRPISANSLAPIPSPATKVSSILTINENKGVNITGSHEVPGKSSTDGASAVSKTGTFSLDALAKAKRALKMKKELEEKLKNLPLANKKNTSSEAKLPLGSKESAKGQSSGSGLLPQSGLKPPDLEAVKRAQEVAVKLGFRQDPHFAPIINMFPGHMPAEVTIQPKPSKAPVLRLDALGREVDEHGNVVSTSKISNLSTLKVNINKQKKEAFQILKPELDVDPEKNPHFDPRMGIDAKKLLRPKKSSFLFVDEGKWSRDAEIIKLKSQFGEAQAKELRVKQAQLAKAKAEPDINPNLIEVSERVATIKEKPKEVIPKFEWWDQSLLQSGTYDDIADGTISEDQLKMEKITIYVEHPRPIEPPAEPALPPPQPLKLTKKEQKKLRTQRRLAREKDRQEMIRQGLLEPPKAKVRMSNLMKVLGSEATQDPTKLEMEIRSAAAEREQAHADRNIARKLTPDERREKRERKLFGDPSSTNLETIVSVYKINDLSPKKLRFKVDVNAQENRLTGCAVISDGISVVVVEGGNKSIKRYGKLMLRRIEWGKIEEEIEGDDMDADQKPLNNCLLVWQGSVAKNSFHRFSVHECRTDAAARKILNDAGVGHYWDLAVNFTGDV